MRCADGSGAHGRALFTGRRSTPMRRKSAARRKRCAGKCRSQQRRSDVAGDHAPPARQKSLLGQRFLNFSATRAGFGCIAGTQSGAQASQSTIKTNDYPEDINYLFTMIYYKIDLIIWPVVFSLRSRVAARHPGLRNKLEFSEETMCANPV